MRNAIAALPDDVDQPLASWHAARATPVPREERVANSTARPRYPKSKVKQAHSVEEEFLARRTVEMSRFYGVSVKAASRFVTRGSGLLARWHGDTHFMPNGARRG